jgi:membrane protease YdiL (CAAX protease family)
MASFDKGLFLWILILELSAILPINLFVAILDFGDYATATSDSALSVASIVGICLLAPFAEELVMRGGVEEYLLRWKPNAALAIVLSSLLFGVLHFYPSLIVTAFLNGLLYGWVYYRSRNVVACFMMHMVNNTASCLADWLRPDDSTSLDILFQTRVIIITLFCIVFMIASLVNIKKKTLQKA